MNYKIEIFYPKYEIFNMEASIKKDAKYKIAKEIWKELEDIPFIENENYEICLDTDNFHGFEKGTPREDIWHWIEENFDISIAKDLMEV